MKMLGAVGLESLCGVKCPQRPWHIRTLFLITTSVKQAHPASRALCAALGSGGQCATEERGTATGLRAITRQRKLISDHEGGLTEVAVLRLLLTGAI